MVLKALRFPFDYKKLRSASKKLAFIAAKVSSPPFVTNAAIRPKVVEWLKGVTCLDTSSRSIRVFQLPPSV